MKIFFLSIGVFWLCGCATAPTVRRENLSATFQGACALGAGAREVKGSIWMKAQSTEASGQFPAQVRARAEPSKPKDLHMEVTNLLGGTEAVIHVSGETYQIQSTNPKVGSRKGVGHWGGIPLRWAADLFLGRVPCPVALRESELIAESDHELRAVTPAGLAGGAETFTYRFRSWAGKPWPEALTWEKQGGTKVEFKFEDPDDKSGSPRKWEAKSDQGEVKVRWRDREVTGT